MLFALLSVALPGGGRAVAAAAVAATLLAVTACGGANVEAPSEVSSGSCSVQGQNRFVRDTLQDIYLWYRELPDPDPARFASPEAYLEGVRYQALDSSFSYITSRAADEAFFSESQFIGFGFSLKLLGADELRVTDVFPESPAAEAEFERGARILDVNGRPVAELVAGGDLGGIFGPNEVGVSATLRFRDRAGGDHQVTMAKRLVTIPTVSVTTTYTAAGRAVGYLAFKNFVRPSIAALDASFAQLATAGARELVLDVRYNGGGLVSVAQHLAGLIGGERTDGQLFVRFVHNDKNSNRDQSLTLPAPANALRLDRLVVIATRSSASASELLISGLRPYLPVVVVGDRTFGKPVGQYGFPFCEKVLHPVSFTARNALDQGDYYDGLAADCAADDDLERDLGDPREASLAEALHYVARGTCTTAAAGRARALARRRPPDRLQPHREDGWQELLGAY